MQDYMQGLFSDTEGDPVQPEDMHITIGLVREEDDEKVKHALQNAAERIPEFFIKIYGFNTFPPSESSDNKTVLFGEPESDIFGKIHKHIFNEFEQAGIEIDNGSHDFKPHITIKYCDKKPELKDKRIDHKVKLRDITFASGGEYFPIKLRKR